MKKVILLSAIAIVLLSSCNQNKTYTVKSLKTGYEMDTQLDLSGHKVGDTVLVFKYPGDIKHNEYVELQITAIK